MQRGKNTIITQKIITRKDVLMNVNSTGNRGIVKESVKD